MARTPFQTTLVRSSGSSPTTNTTYTVPSGKIAVFSAHALTTFPSTVLIGGTPTISLSTASDADHRAQPLTASAGQVVSLPQHANGTPVQIALHGILYDA